MRAAAPDQPDDTDDDYVTELWVGLTAAQQQLEQIAQRLTDNEQAAGPGDRRGRATERGRGRRQAATGAQRAESRRPTPTNSRRRCSAAPAEPPHQAPASDDEDIADQAASRPWRTARRRGRSERRRRTREPPSSGRRTARRRARGAPRPTERSPAGGRGDRHRDRPRRERHRRRRRDEATPCRRARRPRPPPSGCSSTPSAGPLHRAARDHEHANARSPRAGPNQRGEPATTRTWQAARADADSGSPGRRPSWRPPAPTNATSASTDLRPSRRNPGSAPSATTLDRDPR